MDLITGSSRSVTKTQQTVPPPPIVTEPDDSSLSIFIGRPNITVNLRSTPHPAVPPSFHIPRSVPLSAPKGPGKKIKKISGRSAKAADQRARRAEKQVERRKIPTKKIRRHCNLCNVTCNGPRSFDDHIRSKKHRHQITLCSSNLHCVECDRDFESPDHLSRHKKSKGHLRVIDNFNRKLNQ